MNVIEAKKLTKYYGTSKGIDGLDLAVEKGDFFGFIGPNGAGKSTCIRTLLGLIMPTGGSATVLGHDIVTGHNEILKSVGYLPSEINFYSGMKVKDAIRYSAQLRGMDCSKTAAELVERLDLDTEKKVDDLSLGNRKKAGIICAIQHEPELLIMDEPTSGLDPLMQREFFRILSEQNEKGKTVFLSSHILAEVQAHCRTAAFIKDGRIIICDRVEKLEETGAKKVTLRGKVSGKLAAELKEMEQNRQGREVAELVLEDRYASFLYGGDISRLLKLLAEERLKDLSITEPTMEEIFMNYYE
ncbi:MAG: ABC transporter ATP-binding protein [Eubacterium sp.]|nr:ABC transporter ATP-binding protein [Eubacterium sp.]